MSPKIRKKTQEIRQFILQSVKEHPQDVVAVVSERFEITRQAVGKHMTALVEAGLLEAAGKTRSRRYSLRVLAHKQFSESLDGLREDEAWLEHMSPFLKQDNRDNVFGTCNYGFTEMLNNAIDHSEGSDVRIQVAVDAANITFSIEDNGVGVFEKLMAHFGYPDARQAMLELSKGQLTTDRDHHSGQGIFFSSRAADRFWIQSGHVAYVFAGDEWIFDTPERDRKGTFVVFEISRFTDRTMKALFDRYASDDENWDFTRTHISLGLAHYESGDLVSRSQAKRIMARLDGFTEAYLDFSSIDTVGQAFADEIFRVFQNSHPAFRLLPVNTNPHVEAMIRRARSGLTPG